MVHDEINLHDIADDYLIVLYNWSFLGSAASYHSSHIAAI